MDDLKNDGSEVRALFAEVKAPDSVRNLRPAEVVPDPSRRRYWPFNVPFGGLRPLAYALAGTTVVLAGAVTVAVTRHQTPSPHSATSSAIPGIQSPSVRPLITPSGSGASPTSASSASPHGAVTPTPVAGSGSHGTPTRPPVTVNCVNAPSACGYPDATNSGVPAGTALTPVAQANIPGTTWNPGSGTLDVTQAGTVVQNISVGPSGTIVVQANNVTIKNVSVSTAGYYSVVVQSGVSNATVEDATLHGEDSGSNGEDYAVDDFGSNTKVLRINAYWSRFGVNTTGLLQDSYIHDLLSSPSAGAVQGQGSSPIQIIHNTMLNSRGDEDVVFCSNNGCKISNNLVAGGKYIIYGGNGSNGPSGINDVITNNRFSPIYFPNGGASGLDVYFSTSASGNVWSGNVWDNNNSVVSP